MAKRKEEREKQKRKESQNGVIILPLLVGPDGLVDDWHIPTLPHRLPPVLCTGVVGQSWCFVPPGWTVRSMDPSNGSHAGVESTVQTVDV
jgi:hypothetical protein